MDVARRRRAISSPPVVHPVGVQALGFSVGVGYFLQAPRPPCNKVDGRGPAERSQGGVRCIGALAFVRSVSSLLVAPCREGFTVNPFT